MAPGAEEAGFGHALLAPRFAQNLIVADVGMEKWVQRQGASNLETVEEQRRDPGTPLPPACKNRLLRETDFEKDVKAPTKDSEGRVSGSQARTKPRKASEVT